MSGYRRFVAYVYEYVDDNKGENKGFIKVEARNGQCRMHFRLQGKQGLGSVTCKIYGFVREKEYCRTIMLGTCNLNGDMVEFQIVTTERQMAGSAYALDDLAGILIWGERTICYATQWDDEPIPMKKFLPQSESKLQAEPQSGSGQQTEPEPQSGSGQQTEPEPQSGSGQQTEPEPQSESGQQAEPQSGSGQQAEPEPQSESGQQTEPEPQSGPEPQPEVEAEEVLMKAEEWDFQPFADGEIPFCRKIALQDIGMRNQFLLHGYENYQHLLVGRMKEKGQYILGIPGVYDPQERFMAGVFGFPNFKAARGQEDMVAAEENRKQPIFGYWYRLVDASDLDI